MINVLITYPLEAEHMPRFSFPEGISVTFDREPDDQQLSRAEVMIGWLTPEQIRAATSMKLYQAVYAGMDALMVPGILPQGVTLCNATGAFGVGISEYVLTMVLMIYKHMGFYRDNQNDRIWADWGRQESPVGKTLLILGAGDIGTATARLFRPFGCHIIGLRRVPRQVPPEYDRMITMEELDAALSHADIIVGALPSTPATTGLLDRRRLQLLKPSAVLVNVGRGNLIDCDALAELLQQNRLMGAALDVTAPEPLLQDHPLWSCKNALITPHITGGSFGHLKATEDFIFDLCNDNLVNYRDGRPLRNVVDLSTGYKITE